MFPGTHPWNRAFGEQRIDDGLIEVIGLTTYQLPLLQVSTSNPENDEKFRR
jgi:hypothetical protein